MRGLWGMGCKCEEPRWQIKTRRDEGKGVCQCMSVYVSAPSEGPHPCPASLPPSFSEFRIRSPDFRGVHAVCLPPALLVLSRRLW